MNRIIKSEKHGFLTIYNMKGQPIATAWVKRSKAALANSTTTFRTKLGITKMIVHDGLGNPSIGFRMKMVK